jgi:hypothetical protein
MILKNSSPTFSGGFLHRTETILEDKMRRIATENPVEMPYSLKWILWLPFSKDSPCSPDVFAPSSSASNLKPHWISLR